MYGFITDQSTGLPLQGATAVVQDSISGPCAAVSGGNSVSISDVKKWNNLRSNKILVGQRLKINT